MNRLIASTLLVLAVAACSNTNSSEPRNQSAVHTHQTPNGPQASNSLSPATHTLGK